MERVEDVTESWQSSPLTEPESAADPGADSTASWLTVPSGPR